MKRKPKKSKQNKTKFLNNRSLNGCPSAMQQSVKKAKLQDATMIYPKGYSGKRMISMNLFYDTQVKVSLCQRIYTNSNLIFKNFFKFPV